jgi:hypothetical protein
VVLVLAAKQTLESATHFYQFDLYLLIVFIKHKQKKAKLEFCHVKSRGADETQL